MSEEKFEFSGFPNYLEWYKCYDDLAAKDWQDGKELRENKDHWDDKTIAKWNFFYRPFRPVVGRPQKKMIGERKAGISACEEYIREATKQIAEQREIIRKALMRLVAWAVPCMAVILWLLYIGQHSVLVFPLGVSLVALWNFEQKRRTAEARICDLESQIKNHEASIRKAWDEIRLLEGEISQLLKKIPQVEKAETIERWLNEELAEMELIQLGEFVSKPVARENIGEFLHNNFGDSRVCSLLVDSWGFLQPTSQKGPFGWEATGLGRALDDLGNRAQTYQVGSQHGPVFRLLSFSIYSP